MRQEHCCEAQRQARGIVELPRTSMSPCCRIPVRVRGLGFRSTLRRLHYNAAGMSLARRSWEQSIIDDGNRRLPIGANICDRSIDHNLGNLTVTPLNGLRFCAGVNRFPQDEENQVNSKGTIGNESFWSRLARDQSYIHIVCSRSYHLLPMAAPKVVIAPDAM